MKGVYILWHAGRQKGNRVFGTRENKATQRSFVFTNRAEQPPPPRERRRHVALCTPRCKGSSNGSEDVSSLNILSHIGAAQPQESLWQGLARFYLRRKVFCVLSLRLFLPVPPSPSVFLPGEQSAAGIALSDEWRNAHLWIWLCVRGDFGPIAQAAISSGRLIIHGESKERYI